jgi:superfamily II DNA or RNA helicase
MEPWKRYEIQIAQHHSNTYGHKVWLQDTIPEEELYKCGFIHDFNKHRLDRIARRREADGEDIVFSDYGMDILALDESSGKYHACQAKCYTTKRVSAQDLGTFLSVCFLRLHSTGYLYTHGPITNNFRDDILNTPGTIVHHCVPLETKVRNKQSIESQDPLRDYQKEAVGYLAKETDKGDRKVLHLFTGGGKTVIAGHVLAIKPQNIIICIAPLRVSVQQLFERLQPFLPEHESILVDSDAGGTTDEDFIYHKITNGKKLLIYSTYKSAEGVLANIMEPSDDCFLLVDEVHNMVTNKSLMDFAKRFQHSLFLSATIPEELYENIDIADTYEYSLGKAIENQWCVDYQVFLPLLTKDKKDVEISVPVELEGLDVDLCKKAQFLATGMLQQGKRRCVVYMSSIEECGNFLPVLTYTFKEYHGIELWCEKIDCTISTQKRKDRIREFDSGTYDHFKILVSVRVLDEAVDLIKCDCQLVTNPSDNPIRTVQRLGRGMRLDQGNLSKTNAMFLWCDDWSKAVTALSLLKQETPEFHKKIRIISGNYETNQGSKEITEQTSECCEFLRIQCLNFDELWEMRRQEWISQFQILGRNPTKGMNSSSEQEARAATWMNKQRTFYSRGELSRERQNILQITEDWTWRDAKYTWEEQYEHWKRMYETLGQTPRKNGKDVPKNEERAGTWAGSQRRLCTMGELSEQRRKILEKTIGWKWGEKRSAWEEQLEHWKEIYQKFGRKPRRVGNDLSDMERKAGNWMKNQRKFIFEGKLSEDRINILESTEGWEFIERFTWQEQLEHWKETYRILGHAPRYPSEDISEKRASLWMRSQKQLLKKGTLLKDRKIILDVVKE